MKTVPNFCRSFRDEAHHVWRKMTDAERFGIPRSEETSTEELLLNLARKHFGRGLEVKAFTKPQESKNGADWAFWFSDASGKGIGMRVQAKRYFSEKGKESYDSLYHQSDKQKAQSKLTGAVTPNQCETLLNYQDRRDKLVPIYAFYNSDALDLRAILQPHVSQKWWIWRSFPFAPEDWGISAASALAVKHADWGKRNKAGDFAMVPWHCLVCGCCWDERPVDSSLPNLIGHGLRQLYSYTGEELSKEFPEIAILELPFEPTENAPSWVGMLENRSEFEEALSNQMDSLNLKGVAVIQETEARGD